MVTNREEQIRLIAFQLWEKEGRPQGKHFQHWMEAERIWEARMKERQIASHMSPSVAEGGDGNSPEARPSRQEERSQTAPARMPPLRPRVAAAKPPEPEKKPQPRTSQRPKRPDK